MNQIETHRVVLAFHDWLANQPVVKCQKEGCQTVLSDDFTEVLPCE